MKIQKVMQRKIARRRRIRSKVSGTSSCPRVSIFRSNRDMYVQFIDDVSGKTLFGMSTKSLKPAKKDQAKTALAFELGKALGAQAKSLSLTEAVFDRGGNRYGGRVAAVANGLREAGLKL